MKILTVLALGAAVTFGFQASASADNCKGEHQLVGVDHNFDFVTDEGSISGPCIEGSAELSLLSQTDNPDGTFTHLALVTVSDGSFQFTAHGSTTVNSFDPATCHLHQELDGTVEVVKKSATGDLKDVKGSGTFHDVIDIDFAGAPYNCDPNQPIGGGVDLSTSFDLKVKRH